MAIPVGGGSGSGSGSGSSGNLWEPLWLKDMAAWINNPNTPMYGRWNHPPPAGNPNAPGEGGVDLTSPQGTPVYALADGPVLGAGYWNDQNHGVITQRITVPGFGLNDIYYQHIILAPGIKQCQDNNCGTATLKKGQQIGTTGSFGEVEVGFNANWGTIWGTSHPAAWVTDPRPLIAALMGDGTPPTSGVNGTLGAFSNALQGVHFGPNDSVAQFLVNIDTALELQNPFAVQIPDGGGGDITWTPPLIGGITGPIDTGVPNPVSDVRAVFAGAEQIFTNVVNDAAALLVRTMFIVLGISLLMAIGFQMESKATDTALAPVGGKAGAVKLLTGLL